MVLVAEFKPKEERQQQEGDLIKVGKQMLNELLEIDVEDPVVYGIFVKNNTLFTFKMHLTGDILYTMFQLTSILVLKGHADLACLPNIVPRLEQVKVC